MKGLMLTGHRQLLGGHVNTHHLSALAHQLGQQIHIAAAAAAQIEDAASLKQRRTHQAAAVIAAAHLGMHPASKRLEPSGHRIGITASAGLEISAALQLLAVIGLHQLLHGSTGRSVALREP